MGCHVSLEAARTRARIHAAYVAQALPAVGGVTLLEYAVMPVLSPVFQVICIPDNPSEKTGTCRPDGSRGAR